MSDRLYFLRERRARLATELVEQKTEMRFLLQKALIALDHQDSQEEKEAMVRLIQEHRDTCDQLRQAIRVIDDELGQ